MWGFLAQPPPLSLCSPSLPSNCATVPQNTAGWSLLSPHPTPPPPRISFLLVGCFGRQEQGRACPRPQLQSQPARCVALSRLLAPLSRRFFSLPDWLSTASCSTCGLPAGSSSRISAGSPIPPGVYIQTVGTVTSGHPAPQHLRRPCCYFYLRLVNLPRRSGAAPASRCSLATWRHQHELTGQL